MYALGSRLGAGADGMSFPFDPMLIEEAARVEQMHGRTSAALALSQAISLKRIADSFDNPGQGSGSVLYWLEIIARIANAGRS